MLGKKVGTHPTPFNYPILNTIMLCQEKNCPNPNNTALKQKNHMGSQFTAQHIMGCMGSLEILAVVGLIGPTSEKLKVFS